MDNHIWGEGLNIYRYIWDWISQLLFIGNSFCWSQIQYIPFETLVNRLENYVMAWYGLLALCSGCVYCRVFSWLSSKHNNCIYAMPSNCMMHVFPFWFRGIVQKFASCMNIQLQQQSKHKWNLFFYLGIICIFSRLSTQYYDLFHVGNKVHKKK